MTKLSRPAIALVGVIFAFAFGLFAGAPGPTSAATTTVPVADFYFCAPSFENGVCQTTISVGDTVSWDFSGATSTHTTTSNSGLWDSGYENPGGSFQFTFTQAGSFSYHCNVHPTQMMGTIIVQAAAASPTSLATTARGQTPAPGSTPAVGGTTPATAATRAAPLPGTGAGPRASGSTNWWLVGLLGAAGLALSGAGLAYARRKS